jgi:putative transposase
MVASLLRRLRQRATSCSQALQQRLFRGTRPATYGPLAGMAADLTGSKAQLVAANALLRQQLLVLGRQVKRPVCTPRDRALLVLLASRISAWKEAVVIVQPETLLRWHRVGFRLLWRGK